MVLLLFLTWPGEGRTGKNEPPLPTHTHAHIHTRNTHNDTYACTRMHACARTHTRTHEHAHLRARAHGARGEGGRVRRERQYLADLVFGEADTSQKGNMRLQGVFQAVLHHTGVQQQQLLYVNIRHTRLPQPRSSHVSTHVSSPPHPLLRLFSPMVHEFMFNYKGRCTLSHKHQCRDRDHGSNITNAAWKVPPK
jgi:hypothetical protein